MKNAKKFIKETEEWKKHIKSVENIKFGSVDVEWKWHVEIRELYAKPLGTTWDTSRNFAKTAEACKMHCLRSPSTGSGMHVRMNPCMHFVQLASTLATNQHSTPKQHLFSAVRSLINSNEGENRPYRQCKINKQECAVGWLTNWKNSRKETYETLVELEMLTELTKEHVLGGLQRQKADTARCNYTLERRPNSEVGTRLLKLLKEVRKSNTRVQIASEVTTYFALHFPDFLLTVAFKRHNTTTVSPAAFSSAGYVDRVKKFNKHDNRAGICAQSVLQTTPKVTNGSGSGTFMIGMASGSNVSQSSRIRLKTLNF